MTKNFSFTLLILISCLNSIFGQDQMNNADSIFWNITNRNTILWNVSLEDKIPHQDNIEMSGKKVSTIVYYEIDDQKNLTLKRDIIFPQLRTFNKSNEPDWKKYRAYFRKLINDDFLPTINLEDKIIVPSKVDSVEIGGMITFYYAPVENLLISKTIYPSMEGRYVVEDWTIKNVGNSIRQISIENCQIKYSEKGYKGVYHFELFSQANPAQNLSADQSYCFPVYYGATLNEENSNQFNNKTALKERNDFLRLIQNNLVLKTPNKVINTLFYFSKTRAAESIFHSSMGLVHSPGGGNYYVGIWANDQIEYSGPFFPYLGYDVGNLAAYNAYKMFLKNIPTDTTHLPYAFEVDGNFPMEHLDRGDAAMTAYGTSHYLLAIGNLEQANELWPLIEWCLEYCHRKKNSDGAIESESDEMEGRIPTGSANLSTSALYYGGLKYGAQIAEDLKLFSKAKLYKARQLEMEKVIENYFGANIEGLDTYKYFKENKYLRHWICLPLTMGITKRKAETITALFDKLWTNEGVLVELNPDKKSKKATFWDRATLYALRGAMKSGAPDQTLPKLYNYSLKRLLGNHVPYPVEAYPENNMKHLSAESALYCRIFIEGLLGIDHQGLSEIIITPNLPTAWSFVEIENIYIHDRPHDIKITREEEDLRIVIKSSGKIILDKRSKSSNKTFSVKLLK